VSAKVYVLTGRRGSGKTTLSTRLAEQKKTGGWQVTGLLSPARLEGSEKTGINALDIRSGESHLLASRVQGEIASFRYGEWTFDPAVWAWGNQILQASTPTDLLIVDEVGPLEFNLASGWINAFEVLARGSYRAALVVVRPECLESARCRFGPFQLFDLDSPRKDAFEILTNVCLKAGL
jgi:nucleoside-triphosphatase THEP1